MNIKTSPRSHHPTAEQARYGVHKKESFSSFLFYVLVAILLAIGIRFYVAAPYLVAGSSMEPTFHDYHYLIIDRLVYKLHLPERGDVVVFKYPPQPSRSLIKRVIGLPGEKVKLNGGQVVIFNKAHPTGFILDEPYLSEENRKTFDHTETTLDPNEYFVLGDNRRVSADSRVWGPLPKEDITGRVDLRLYPVSDIGILPGEARYLEK